MTACSIAGCDRRATRRGMCNRHYENQRLRGQAVPVRDLSLREHLERIGWDVTPAGCWEWRGSRNELGYGLLNQVRAHRLMYEIHHGAMPPDLVVRHHCDNPPCVNPEHLAFGTQRDNNRDMAERGRRKRSLCPRGHDRTAVGATTGRDRECLECKRQRGREWQRANRARPITP